MGAHHVFSRGWREMDVFPLDLTLSVVHNKKDEKWGVDDNEGIEEVG